MQPSGYPWAVPARAGVVGPSGLEPGPAPAVDGRTAVVAVGANASPEVLVRKLGGLLDTHLPLAPAVAEDLLVGHSAHVSARGYVAAAPAPCPGMRTDLVVGWFDAAQLARLDETEPNYRRVSLPSPCRVDGVEVAAQVYVSVHGLLTDEGEVLPLRPQVQVLRWLSERMPDLGDLTHERLTDPGLRERVRRAIIAAGLRADPWRGADTRSR